MFYSPPIMHCDTVGCTLSFLRCCNNRYHAELLLPEWRRIACPFSVSCVSFPSISAEEAVCTGTGGGRLFGRIVFQFRSGGSKTREILTAMLLLLIYWYLTYWQPSFSDLYFDTRSELENYTTFRKVENCSVFKCLNLQIYIVRPYVSKSCHVVVNLARRDVTVFPCPGFEVNLIILLRTRIKYNFVVLNAINLFCFLYNLGLLLRFLLL